MKNMDFQRNYKQEERREKKKAEFLSIINHEMRNSLNSIVGFLQILKTTDLNEEQLELVSYIDASSNMLIDLVNEILEAEKYSKGKMLYVDEAVNLKEIVEEAICPFQSLINSKGIDFILDTFLDLNIEAEVDQMKLKQLFANLLSNALKFTAQGEIKVKVEAFLQNEYVKLGILVSDTGIGINEEKQQHLFSPYMQADRMIAKEFGGTGLGLVICKEIVSHYGGAISVESTYGKGTTFYAILKLKRAIHEKTEKKDMSSGCEEKVRGEEKYRSVLVAEDNSTNQILMSKYLEKLHFPYKIAKDGEEAVHWMEKQSFDIILMDCQMPVMDGFEATKRIREKHGDDVKIIAMTAYTSTEDMEKCIASGMDGYMSKPIDYNQLVEILQVGEENKKIKEQVMERETKFLMTKLPFDYDTCYELLETYVAQMKEGLTEVAQYMEAMDYERLEKKIHQLKGASGAARQDEIFKKLEAVEICVRERHFAKIVDYIDEIERNPVFIK